MAGFLLFCSIVGAVGWFWFKIKDELGWSLVSGAISILGAVGFLWGGAYLAGQGDARSYAEEWVDKWMPVHGVAIECQARDTDDNGYVTCTVGAPGDPQGPTAIECGVNRWYHGYNVTGCRLMKGYSGRQ